MDERDTAALEDRRQLEHFLPVGFAFLLPYLPYWGILALALLAVLYALVISPRLTGFQARPAERQGSFSPGKLYYALSVLALLLIFRERLYIATAVWGILAAGDSVSNVVGRRLGRVRLPYNSSKSLIGSLSFWLSSWLAGWLLLVWNLPSGAAFSPELIVVYSACAALLCALAESLPAVIDDNVAICWVGAAVFWLLFSISDPSPSAAQGLGMALALNLIAAVLARLLGWLSWRGSLLAVAVGILVFTAMGWQGYLIMVTFLVLGSVTTRVGFVQKEKLQVAQADSGQRGISNILSNGLVAVTLAVFAFWLDSSVVRVAFCASVATAAFDTVSTELGQVLGRHPFDPLRLRRVPVGTQGAVSIEGSLAGMVAALTVALVAVVVDWLPAPAAVVIFAGAVAGAFFESVMGSLRHWDGEYSDEALNLYSTFFGACTAAVLWMI